MKISQLNKTKISLINKFLKKNGVKPFLIKEIKAIMNDDLNLIYFHDELIVRGTIHIFHDEVKYYALALSHGLEVADVLILDNDFSPIRIEEGFNIFDM